MENRKIKDIYNKQLDTKNDSSLVKHYNKILLKTFEELDTSDICFLLRQNEFLDRVVSIAIELIKSNHNIGDLYDYEMLVNLSDVKHLDSILKTDISNLINLLEKDYSGINFELDSDREDYLEAIKKLKNINYTNK